MTKSNKDLNQIKREALKDKGDWIKVGMSTCGNAAGAEEVYHTLLEDLQDLLYVSEFYQIQYKVNSPLK